MGNLGYEPPFGPGSTSDGSTPDASSTTKGKVALAGDLAGPPEAPTVPALADRVPKTSILFSRPYVTPNAPGDQTTGMQAFLAAWATQGGLAILEAGNYNVSGALSFNHTAGGGHARFALFGYGATITSTYNGLVVGDSLPADDSAAAALLQRRLAVYGLRIVGNGGTSQTGIRPVCRGWLHLEDMQVEGCDTNYDIVFCLQGRVAGCNSHVARRWGYRCRSGAGLWTGATGPNSASNHMIFCEGTRDYGYAVAANVSNKALASNVATITTTGAHDFRVGQGVTVAGVDSTFNGDYTIASTPTASTFTYAKTAADVGSASAAGTATAHMAAQFFVEDSQGVMLRDTVTEGFNPVDAIHYTTIVHDTIYGHSGGRTFSVQNHHSENFPTNAHVRASAYSGHVVIDELDSQTGGVLIDGSLSGITAVIIARLPTIPATPAFKTSVGGPRWYIEFPSNYGATVINTAGMWVGGVVGSAGILRFNDSTAEASVISPSLGIAGAEPWMHASNDLRLMSDRAASGFVGIHLEGPTELKVGTVPGEAFMQAGFVGLGVDATTDEILFAWRRSSTSGDYGIARLPIDGKLRESTKTADYVLVLGDIGTVVGMNLAGANTLTVPPNSSVAFPIGTVIEVYQHGAGQTTITAGSGVSLRSSGGKLKINAQYGSASLRKRGTDEWVVAGDLAA